MQHNNIEKTSLALSPFVLSYVLAMDIIIPSLPEFIVFFNATQATVQLIISLFPIAAGIMQIFMGPMLDRFGRKRISIYCSIGYIAASILCAYSTTLTQLNISRFLEALFSTGLFLTAFAVISDNYENNVSARGFNYMNTIMSVSPLIAPAIGSWLDILYGWRASFIFLSIIGLFALYVSTTCVTDKIKQPEIIKNKIIKDYCTIFKNRDFLIYTYAVMAGLTYLFIFFSTSPYIIEKLLDYTKLQFSFWFAFMGIAVLLGSFISARIVFKLGIYKTVLAGIILTLSGGIIMLGWYMIFGLSIYNFVLPMLLIGIGAVFCMGSGMAGAVQLFPKITGTASAAVCSVEFILSALIGTLIMLLPVTSSNSFSVPVVIMSIIGLFFMFFVSSKKKQSH